MSAHGWHGAEQWRERACDIAPTLVGGSKKRGRHDLGPPAQKKHGLPLVLMAWVLPIVLPNTILLECRD